MKQLIANERVTALDTIQQFNRPEAMLYDILDCVLDEIRLRRHVPPHAKVTIRVEFVEET